MENQKDKVIRLATESDIEFIYEMICELEECQFDKDQFMKVVRSNLLNPNIFYIVCESNHTLEAFISLHIQTLLHHCGNIGEIQELIVRKELRGTGIGHFMMEKVKELAREKHCLQLEVCCNQKRIASHQFYLAEGMSNHHFKFSMEL